MDGKHQLDNIIICRQWDCIGDIFRGQNERKERRNKRRKERRNEQTNEGRKEGTKEVTRKTKNEDAELGTFGGKLKILSASIPS